VRRNDSGVTAIACLAVALCSFPCPTKADLFALGGYGTFSTVAQYDDAGRLVRTFPGTLESNEGLAVSPDGWLYQSGNVLGDGYLIRQRVEDPSVAEGLTPSFGGIYGNPGGITVGPDGAVYVTSTTFNPGRMTGVLRYDPRDRSFLPVVSLEPPPRKQYFETFARATAVAPGGDIYLLRRGVGVERYSGEDGSLLGLIVPAAGTSPGDVEIGPDGNVYVTGLRGVSRYDAQSGAFIDDFIPNGAGGLNGAS
jgi:hypothetical protein